MKKGLKIIIVLLIIVIISLLLFFLPNRKKEVKEKVKGTSKIVDTSKYKNNYNTYMIVNKDTNIYDKKKNKIGFIKKDSKVILDDNYEIVDKFFKLDNEEYYIDYKDLDKSDIFTYDNEYKTYKNYIPYNLIITTKDSYKLMIDDIESITINTKNSYKVIIKDSDRYGIEYNKQLYYIAKSDIESLDGDSTRIGTESLAVLNYHYTIDKNSSEGRECRQNICMDQTQVEEEIKYLKDNDFYAVTMEDLYLFLTDKINLPEKSVAITIDDGWYLARMISILEKYQMQGTLYLIGSLASPSDYKSDYLEIHSHSWDMHTLGVCKGYNRGGGLVCLDEKTVLEDLKKSRESLNNTEVFCYPFFEYNDRAISLLKKAGFKMALAGGSRKAKPGDNMYIIPRYELSNSTTMNQFINMVN